RTREHCCLGGERGKRPHRRKPGCLEPGPGPCAVSRKSLKEFWRVRKRHTPVTGAVFVPATEAVTRVAEEQRTRRHQLGACRCAVLKSAAHDDGDRGAGILFLKRSIARAGRAHQVGYRPPVTGCSPARRWNALLRFDRNFCQEFG